MFRIRETRIEAGVTQAELAKNSGLGQSCICMYEKGQRMPSLEAACRIADALHCSLDKLAGRDTTNVRI